LPALRQAAQTVTQLTATAQKLDSRMTAAESELDTLHTLSGRFDALNTAVTDLRTWQVTTDRRINDLLTKTVQIDALGTRITAVEQSAAESRNSLGVLTGTVSRLSTNVDSLGTLRTTLTALDTRIKPLETRRPIG
jgi:chromosome segregation ATPase